MAGRPRKEVDWDTVAKLAAIHCTKDEIAAFCEVSKDTLERRCEEATGLDFAAYYDQKRETGRISLRRKQFTLATEGKGNATMLIWLGKQWLGQMDGLSIVGDSGVTVNLTMPSNGREAPTGAETIDPPAATPDV